MAKESCHIDDNGDWYSVSDDDGGNATGHYDNTGDAWSEYTNNGSGCLVIIIPVIIHIISKLI